MKIPSFQIRTAGFTFARVIKYLSILIPLAIAGNILYIIIVTKQSVFSQLTNFNIPYLTLAVLLSFVPWFTQSTALFFWSKLFNKRLKPAQAFKTVLATELGGAIVPVAVGGGYVKLGFLLNYGFTVGEATMVTLLGVIADGAFFIIALPLALLFSGAWEYPVIRIIKGNVVSHWQMVLIIVLIICTALFVIKRLIWKNIRSETADDSPKKNKGIIRWWSWFKRFLIDLNTAAKFAAKNGKGTFAAASMVLGIGWCCRYGAISALVLGLGHKADPVLFFLLQWVVFSASSLLPTPGGIGSAELSFALIYDGLVPSELIPILTGAWRFITFYMIVASGALILTLMGVGSPRKKAKGDLTKMTEEITV
jgi:glycosyltransferase 2 family protein